MPATTRKPIALALQGGGAHSAFTWGVLDYLLTDRRIAIEAVSATSGGAMLAVLLAQGMQEGGEDGARDLMLRFWRKVSAASSLLPVPVHVADKMLGHVALDLSASSIALDYLTRMFSPYQFNLFDLNPLRGIVEELVDFSAIARRSPIELYINATHARTGNVKIFEGNSLTLDAVMASSCLPFIFKTVEIDGEPYWDGSFSGCPALSPLVNRAGTSDIVLVEVHPAQIEEMPTAAADILDRATEIGFQSVLLHELKTIELYNTMIEMGKLDQKPAHFHCIEAREMLSGLGRASKLNAEWDFLIHLHDIGVQAAADWLEAHFDAVGKGSSANINASAAA